MAALNLLKLSFLINLLSSWNLSLSPDKNAGGVSVFPPTCNSIECPSYDVIHAGNGFEIRRYNSSMWASTQPIDDASFVSATRKGFLQLFFYILGKNDYKQKIEMTGPVMTEVKPSDGASSFVVSFYIPKVNQPNPPPAESLHVQKWGICGSLADLWRTRILARKLQRSMLVLLELNGEMLLPKAMQGRKVLTTLLRSIIPHLSSETE